VRNLEQRNQEQIASTLSKRLEGRFVTEKARSASADLALSMTEVQDNELEQEHEQAQEMRNSVIKVEMYDNQNIGDLRKRSRARSLSGTKYHYRRTMYDVAFGMSITDEIMNLEPLEDKLSILRRKQMQTPFDILMRLRARMTFFAIYNLFDTVEHNHVDN